MAAFDNQPTVSLTAGATFSKSDLYKFVQINSSGHVVIADTTSGADVCGTLRSVTNTTSGAGSEPVTVGLLLGIGPVRLGGSTRSAGQTIGASSAGYGVVPSTDALQLGHIVVGSSGSTGRIAQVLFNKTSAP